ncbi:hypothetical protein BU16DRAFT_562818 [Lophium mytilinum]|uniref:Uncharacterized protein n=1 Tax=Lophium mytilinum TaxID=390894 RepID=A0A6A6QP11_9PEZI|nr:hypothetical protein BU16DRAFT_562818 [Lophium mytilinum]
MSPERGQRGRIAPRSIVVTSSQPAHTCLTDSSALIALPLLPLVVLLERDQCEAFAPPFLPPQRLVSRCNTSGWPQEARGIPDRPMARGDDARLVAGGSWQSASLGHWHDRGHLHGLRPPQRRTSGKDTLGVPIEFAVTLHRRKAGTRQPSTRPAMAGMAVLCAAKPVISVAS